MDSISYRKISKWKYELNCTATFYLPEFKGITSSYHDWIDITDGDMIIKKRYAWNGANFVPDTEATIKASLPHDAIYQLIKEGKLNSRYRKNGDRVFRRFLEENGMSYPTSLYYRGVRYFGRFFI